VSGADLQISALVLPVILVLAHAANLIADGGLTVGTGVVVTNPDGASASRGKRLCSAGSNAYQLYLCKSNGFAADGWSYIATTAGGAPRDTEQTGALAPDYNQATHPVLFASRSDR